MNAIGDRLCAGWVGLYTSGLPPEVADRRREEVRSDLFEHATLAGVTPVQQAEVLGRVLWGIPADLSWRRAARAPRERRLVTGAPMTTSNPLRTALTSASVLAMAACLYSGTALDLSDADGGFHHWWQLGLVIGAGLIAGALVLRDRHPGAAAALVSLGAVTPLVLMPWTATVTGPIWLAATVLAILNARQGPRLATG